MLASLSSQLKNKMLLKKIYSHSLQSSSGKKQLKTFVYQVILKVYSITSEIYLKYFSLLLKEFLKKTFVYLYSIIVDRQSISKNLVITEHLEYVIIIQLIFITLLVDIKKHQKTINQLLFTHNTNLIFIQIKFKKTYSINNKFFYLRTILQQICKENKRILYFLTRVKPIIIMKINMIF